MSHACPNLVCKVRIFPNGHKGTARYSCRRGVSILLRTAPAGPATVVATTGATLPVATGVSASLPWRKDNVAMLTAKLQVQFSAQEEARGIVLPTPKRVTEEIARLEACIKTAHERLPPGKAPGDMFGDEKRAIELKQQAEDGKEKFREEARRIANAKLVWVENLAGIKRELARTQHALRETEARIKKRSGSAAAARTHIVAAPPEVASPAT